MDFILKNFINRRLTLTDADGAAECQRIKLQLLQSLRDVILPEGHALFFWGRPLPRQNPGGGGSAGKMSASICVGLRLI
jgi:hypothetical protein